jgi:phosphatidylglycerophosphatase A
MKTLSKTLVELIVTCFYIGKIKYAPGTMGSLLAFPLSYAIASIAIAISPKLYGLYLTTHQPEFITVLIALSIVILGLFILGAVCATKYVAINGTSDPKEIVIDELVGQMIVITFGSLSAAFVHFEKVDAYLDPQLLDFLFFFLLPFTLFRIFDIFKPFPIDWIDQNIHGGVGIMADDILAAVFALITQYFITFTIIDLIK